MEGRIKFAVTLVVFSMVLFLLLVGRFAKTGAAKTGDSPVEQKLEEVLRNQERMKDTLSIMQSDIKSIAHEVAIIKERVR